MYLSDNTTNTNNSEQITPIAPKDIPNTLTEDLNIQDNIKSTGDLKNYKTEADKKINYIKSPNTDILLYIQESQDFTDKYIQCAECGGYLALGNVTKLLPENLICHAHKDMVGGDSFDADYPWILSYNDIMTHEETGNFPESVYERVANHYNLTLDQYYDCNGLDGREITAYLNDNGEIIYFNDESLHTGDVDVDSFVSVPAVDNTEMDNVDTENTTPESNME